jgi:hypothetical protein
MNHSRLCQFERRKRWSSCFQCRVCHCQLVKVSSGYACENGCTAIVSRLTIKRRINQKATRLRQRFRVVAKGLKIVVKDSFFKYGVER